MPRRRATKLCRRISMLLLDRDQFSVRTAPKDSAATLSPQEPLRSVHTANFGRLLEQLGITLLVSTYQAGKLVMLRAQEGQVNTHFRSFNAPMGVACDGQRLAVGTDRRNPGVPQCPGRGPQAGAGG